MSCLSKVKVYAVFLLLLVPLMLLTAPIKAETYHSGLITADETWYAKDNPHIIIDKITVEEGVVLTIEPGVVVKFDGYHRINVFGALVAKGNENRILFTSNLESPSFGSYFGITFKENCDDDNCVIDGVDIEYAFEGVFCEGASPTISNSTISTTYIGIECSQGSNPIITSNRISTERYGIYTSYDSNPLIKNNRLSDGDIGIKCVQANPTIVDNYIISHDISGIELDSQSDPHITNTTIANYVSVNVTNKFGMPVEDANIEIEDIYGENVFEGHTDANGCINQIPLREYLIVDNIWNEFTPHTIFAEKYGVANNTIVTMDKDRTASILLDYDEEDMLVYIRDSFNDDMFMDPQSQRMNALRNKINALIKMYNTENYNGFLKKLEKDVQKKIDCWMVEDAKEKYTKMINEIFQMVQA